MQFKSPEGIGRQRNKKMRPDSEACEYWQVATQGVGILTINHTHDHHHHRFYIHLIHAKARVGRFPHMHRLHLKRSRAQSLFRLDIRRQAWSLFKTWPNDFRARMICGTYMVFGCFFYKSDALPDAQPSSFFQAWDWHTLPMDCGACYLQLNKST